MEDAVVDRRKMTILIVSAGPCKCGLPMTHCFTPVARRATGGPQEYPCYRVICRDALRRASTLRRDGYVVDDADDALLPRRHFLGVHAQACSVDIAGKGHHAVLRIDLDVR
jgi:hypothetical protein